MFLTFARRALRILPQVRSVRNQPAAVGPLPPIREGRRRKETFDDVDYDEELIVGETVEVDLGVLRKDKRKQKHLLEDPSVMTLVKEHRVDFDTEKEPKVGYSDDELALFDSIAEIKIDDALQNFKESSFDAEFLDSVGPGLKPTYNVAALADKHEVIKQLVALNVPVYKWDSKPKDLQTVLALNWLKDCKPRIEFLLQKCRIEVDTLPKMLSRNPRLLAEEMQHLEARLEYLSDKKAGLGFKRAEVARVLSKEAFWLSTPIEAIENRMNFFRNQFALDSAHFRRLIVSRPTIIMVKLRNLAQKKFTMVEEMGFNQAEIRRAIYKGPKILTISTPSLVDRFQVLHLDIGYPHELLASHPQAMYSRASRLRERHAFLKYVGRDQYNFSMPGYVSPERISRGDDEEFVTKVACSTKEKFEKFIKNQ